MVVGFNHNFNYKGQTYHVQTEDSGTKNPHIITLLYRGGTILSSKKTSYADIIKVDNLEAVVEELMKAQHREMLRLLKNGDFDDLLGLPPAPGTPKAATKIDIHKILATEENRPPSSSPPVAAPATLPPVTVPAPPAVTAAATPPVPPPAMSPEKKPLQPPPAPAALTLDDIILSYMVGEERKK